MNIDSDPSDRMPSAARQLMYQALVAMPEWRDRFRGGYCCLNEVTHVNTGTPDEPIHVRATSTLSIYWIREKDFHPDQLTLRTLSVDRAFRERPGSFKANDRYVIGFASNIGELADDAIAAMLALVMNLADLSSVEKKLAENPHGLKLLTQIDSYRVSL